jgi:NAD(P)H dehydrogenase (quinone)
VLPTFAVYDAVRIDAGRMALIESAWHTRLQDLFDSAPIAFRTQNGGDYPDRHVLAEDVVPGVFGLDAHIKTGAANTARVRSDIQTRAQQNVYL